MPNSERISDIMKDVLFKTEELPEDGAAPENAVIVEGLTNKFGFHPDRLESHREEIEGMLKELPDSFLESKGGGMSFLNMCNDSKGEQWTSFHRTMEELLVLALGLGVGSYCAPRGLWGAFPGGMPYVSFNL